MGGYWNVSFARGWFNYTSNSNVKIFFDFFPALSWKDDENSKEHSYFVRENPQHWLYL